MDNRSCHSQEEKHTNINLNDDAEALNQQVYIEINAQGEGGGGYSNFVCIRRGDRGKVLRFSNISHFIQHELIYSLLNVVYMKIHMFLN